MARFFRQPGKTGLDLNAVKTACDFNGKICHDSIDSKRRIK